MSGFNSWPWQLTLVICAVTAGTNAYNCTGVVCLHGGVCNNFTASPPCICPLPYIAPYCSAAANYCSTLQPEKGITELPVCLYGGNCTMAYTDPYFSCDCSSIRISAVNLTGITVTGSNVTNTSVTSSIVTCINVTGTNVSGITVSGVNLVGITVAGINVGSINVGSINVTGVSAGGTNVTGIGFAGIDVTGVNVTGANLWGTRCEKITICATINYSVKSNFTSASKRAASMKVNFPVIGGILVALIAALAMFK